MTTDSLGIARAAIARGWRPIPLDHPSHRRCIGSHADHVEGTGRAKVVTPFDRKECEAGVSGNGLPRESRRGKHPIGGWATIAATEMTSKMTDHYFARQTVNVGIATQRSGLFVVDEDVEGAFERLCAELGHPVPKTYRVRTAKGWHWYFAAPTDVVLSNASGVLKARGMDVRGGKGSGGYVVAAGSLHHSGHVYEAEDDDAAVLPTPAWLVGVLTDPGEVDGAPEEWKARPAAHRDDPDDVRMDSLDALVATYRGRLDAVTTPGWRHTFFAAARDAWRLYDLDALPMDEMAGDLEQTAARVWGSGLDARDRDIWRVEARRAATASPWAVHEAGGVKIERSRTRSETSADGDDDQVDEGAKREARIATFLAVELERREVRRRADAHERGTAPPPSSTSLRALLGEESAAAKYRVDRLWPSGGKVLITAAKKSGKTTTVGNLVRCLVDGDRFLGRPFDTVQGAGPGFDVVDDGRAVFLLDFEMTRDMLREWLGAQQIENVDRVHVELMRGRTLDLRDDAVRGAWAAHLRSLDVGTLILDPVGPLLAGLGLDENSNTDVGGFLAALDRLCLEAGVSEYAVVHHAGHGDEQRARGASAFVGWPDAWWQLTRDQDAPVTFLRAEGRDVAVDETRLVFDRATRRLTMGEGNRAQAKAAVDVEAVVALVKEEPGSTGRDLQKALRESDNFGTERARAAIAAAVSARLIHVHPGERRAQHHHPEGACDRCETLKP